jgi:cystathionine gamma-synthase
VTRFFIHKLIVAFADDMVAKYETLYRKAILFLSCKTAQRCHNFIKAKAEPRFAEDVRMIDLFLDKSKKSSKVIAKGELPV